MSGLSEIEVEEDGFRLRISNGEVLPLRRDGVIQNERPIISHDYIVAQAANSVGDGKVVEGNDAEDISLYIIKSPMVGTFYSSSSPDAPNFVDRNSSIKPSTVVCIIEAMKVMNEIQADVEGVIVDILVKNGQTVEYGQPLFKVKKS